MTPTFVSYSWDDDEHRIWIRDLATRLRSDGVDVILDQWNAAPGDQLPAFKERAIRENQFVLIVCTPGYKARSDERRGGVGYEGDIITGEVAAKQNHRKFIPVLRSGNWNDTAPSWIVGKYFIHLRGAPYSEVAYTDLLATLHGDRPQAPPLGRKPAWRETVWLRGTTIDEVERYHRDTLKLVSEATNKAYDELRQRQKNARKAEEERRRAHDQSVRDAAKRISFD